jgi:hypothetical protein
LQLYALGCYVPVEAMAENVMKVLVKLEDIEIR